MFQFQWIKIQRRELTANEGETGFVYVEKVLENKLLNFSALF